MGTEGGRRRGHARGILLVPRHYPIHYAISLTLPNSAPPGISSAPEAVDPPWFFSSGSRWHDVEADARARALEVRRAQRDRLTLDHGQDRSSIQHISVVQRDDLPKVRPSQLRPQCGQSRIRNTSANATILNRTRTPNPRPPLSGQFPLSEWTIRSPQPARFPSSMSVRMRWPTC